jgi:hypothetical protein
MSKIIKDTCLFIILILSLSFTVVNCGYIIPDSQHPIFIKYPTFDEPGQTITLNFSFPDTSPGLSYLQYFGLVLPEETATLIDFSQIKHSCKLQNIVENKNYAIQASISKASSFNNLVEAQKYIAFCQFQDSDNLKANVSYTLSITINSKLSLKSPYLKIGLFTSTDNNSERMIIDYIPVIGSLNFYPNYKIYT